MPEPQFGYIALGNVKPFSQKGFTLIELLVTVAIAVVLAAIAVPSFSGLALSSKLTSASNSWAASAQLARSEAIKRNATVTLCASATGTSCASSGGWHQGWIVLAPAVGAIPAQVIQYQQALPSGYLMNEASGLHTLTFPAIIVGVTPATLKACRATPSAGSEDRSISITATGQTTITKKATGTCS